MQGPASMRLFRHKWLKRHASIRVYDFNFHCNRGFTLIEILVVVIIIGIVLSVAVPKLYPDENERLRQEADRTLALLETARDEAAFGGRTIGFNIADNTLTFFERDAESIEPKWLPISSEKLRARPFVEGVNAALQIGPRDMPTDSKTLALFKPSGVALPFEIQLFSPVSKRTIAADALGNLAMANETDQSNAAHAANTANAR